MESLLLVRRRELLFGMGTVEGKLSATGDCLRLSIYPGTVSALTGGDADVNGRDRHG